MVSKTLFVLLVAACCVHSLDAWPWPWHKSTTTRRPTTTTTTTTPAPAIMPREAFLAQIANATKTIKEQVAKTHQLVQEADDTDKVGEAVAKIDVDVPAYTKRFTEQVLAYANMTAFKTVDTKPCVDKYMEEKAYVEAYMRVYAVNSIDEDMQDVRDTATKADSLLDSFASVTAEAEAEAAKPDGEYGENVDAILAKASEAVSTAEWNNEHVGAILYDFKFATSMAQTFTDCHDDLSASRDYSAFCMRRTDSALNTVKI